MAGKALVKPNRNKAARFGTSGHTHVTLLGTVLPSDSGEMEPTISNRFFQRMSDSDLLQWRPSSYHGNINGNVAKANREYRRRAARAGFDDVYAWMEMVK